MTPFGDEGPWSSFKGSDLVHLALGGVMMNCGYDPNPANEYDLPPIAPQIWHAYHIAGEQLLIGILAALIERRSSGLGQDVSCAIHEAVAKNTELDLMSWVMRRAPLYRLTCRHASETVTRVPSISHTKDGRWFMTWGVGVARPRQSHAVPRSLWDGGGSSRSRRLERRGRAQYSGHGGGGRTIVAHARSDPAFRPRLYLRQNAVERGAGRGPALGAGPKAARKRQRRALAETRRDQRDRSSRGGPVVSLSDQQVVELRDPMAARPPRAAHRRRYARSAEADE